MIELPQETGDLEPCPYLPGKKAQLRYRFVASMTPLEYDRLLAKGWRRFGSSLFRPVCPDCSECVPIRVPAARFRPTRSQRRTATRNRNVEIEIVEPTVSREHLTLYGRYHAERSETRGWPLPRIDIQGYLESFLANAAPTHEFQYRLDQRLIAIGYVGEATTSLNAIYTFADPAEKKRSLGTFNILSQIAEANRRKKRYLYLGFRVRLCPSMSYKAKFNPHELLIDSTWREG